MRRFVEASGGRASKRSKIRSAVIEAMEPRVLLSASVHPAAITYGGNGFFYPYETLIDGTVYLDTNNNGAIDAGDATEPGQTVFVDQIQFGHDVGAITSGFSGNGSNPLNPITSGAYSLVITAAGTYRVRLVPGTGLAVEPSSPGLQQDITILSLTQTVENVDFLEVPQATVSGTVFNDANHNGIQDAGEHGLAGRTVWADINGNGVLDPDDVSAVTDASGNYTILNVPPGTYNVHMTNPAGSSSTSPASGQFSETLVSGQNITNVNFGTVGTDLSVAMISAPPASAIGTYPVKRPALISVTNTGDFVIDGLVGVKLYASLDTSLDSNDFVIGQQLGKSMKLKPGQSKIVRLRYTVPSSVPTGNYHLLAQVVSSVADSNPSNDVFANTATTTISQPFIDMGVSYGATQLVVSPGQQTAASVVVTNNGNIDFKGTYTLQVYASMDPSLTTAEGSLNAQPVVIGKLSSLHLKLHPHQSKVITVPIVFSGVTRQYEFLITTLDTTNPLGDNNLANNTAVSALPSLLQ